VSTGLVALVCGLAAAHLVAYYADRRATAGMLKALPILLLAWTAWTAPGPAGVGYASLVAVGLVCSAVGDVSLVFPAAFLAGLAAFFLAHLCYIVAFAPGAVMTPPAATAGVAIALVAGTMLRYLWPHVARLRAPVVIYVGALGLMAWCAIARAIGANATTGDVAAAIGAISFLVSDSVLAVDRFARPFAGAHAVVMATYYAAQLLIARSAV
jgi:uncharacterized membrane protein YhhN